MDGYEDMASRHRRRVAAFGRSADEAMEIAYRGIFRQAIGRADAATLAHAALAVLSFGGAFGKSSLQ